MVYTTLKEYFEKEHRVDINIFNKEPEELIKNPFMFTEMHRQIELLKKSYESNNNVFYLVDTDVDGITSASLMISYFKNIYPKAHVSFKVNDNKRHGVFLDYKEIGLLSKGDTLIVNDAGSNDIKNIEELLKRGVSVIITDHHDIEEENIYEIARLLNDYPNYSIVSPRLEPFECHMTGSGMAHKVITAFDHEYHHGFSKQYFDLATTGIIADMESFDEEVLGYLKRGLTTINNLELKEIMINRVNKGHDIDASDISFYVSPMINSVFRIGNNNQRKFVMNCFLTNDYYHKEFPNQLEDEEVHDFSIRMLNMLKKKQNDNIDEAIKHSKMIENELLVVIIQEKFKNFTGLIANKLTNEYKKPCVVVWSKKDSYIATGSARSCVDYNMKHSLLESDLFEYCAGHEQAFGLGFKKANLKKILKLSVPKVEKKIDYHFEFDFDDLDVNLLFETCQYNSYYMRGFEAPNFRINNIKIDSPVRKIGKNGLKFKNNDIEFVTFDANGLKLSKGDTCSIVGKVSLNEYRGEKTLQFKCEDIVKRDDK